jgi:hypothetical protein
MSPWQLENLKGAIALADGVIKSLILVNGAAAVGLLTFMGNTQVISSGLRAAMGMFARGGVFAAIVCTIFAYLAQRTIAIGSGAKIEMALTIPGFLSTIISAALFGFGIHTAGFALG